jgi:hypothetical protein
MAGFLCKQVAPYNFEFSTDTTVGGTPSGEVRFNNGTASSITNMFINLYDADNIKRQDWLDSFYTSEVAGRDLLTLTYKDYDTLGVATITAATPTVITTSVVHNLTAGDTVKIATTGAVPDVDGNWVVLTVASSVSFTIDTGVATAAGPGGTVEAYGDYVMADVIFEIKGTSVAVADGIATVSVDYISGTLAADGTDVTLSYNKAGVVPYKFWYGNCTRVQEGLGLCSSVNGAWVPAVTVCKEEL